MPFYRIYIYVSELIVLLYCDGIKYILASFSSLGLWFPCSTAMSHQFLRDNIPFKNIP